MRTMVIIAKNIFAPISAFLFLGIGILACLYSGIIEYSVLNQLITIPNDTSSIIRPETWAIILVFVLEGSKFTLHFYSSSLKKKQVNTEIQNEINARSFYRIIVVIKNSLIAISFICSIIFVTNIFFHDNGEAKQKAIEENNILCDTKLSEGKKQLTDEYSSYITEHLNLYKSNEEYIDSLMDDLSQKEKEISNTNAIVKRKDLREEAEAIRNQIDIATAKYNAIKGSIESDASNIMNTKLIALEKKYGDNGTERISIGNTLELEAKGDNNYLSTFLRSISKTFLNRFYGRKTYFFCVILLSMVIAAVLEACIYISQTLLTISEKAFFTIIGETSITEEEKKIVNFLAWLLFSIACLLAIYILSGLILTVNLTRTKIIMAIISYIITMLLMNMVWEHRNTNPRQNADSPSNKHWMIKILLTLREAAIPAILSFVGYALVGFIYDGNFLYGDLNALAIAVGGSLAQCFQKKKYCT